MKDKLKLSISILTNGKSKDLWKTIESVHKIQEKIPSEFIIVDTGCPKDLHNRLAREADRLINFIWCDDFAKARNAGLEVAEGEWFLFLDDDEWFEDISELVDFFETGKSQFYGYAYYKVRNYMDMEGSVYSDSWALRMARNVKSLHFESRIHEYLAGKEGEEVRLPLVAEHYGYVFANEQEKIAHFKRNETLLLAMMEEEPEGIRWPMQLIQEYRAVRHYDQMIALGKKYYEQAKTTEQWKYAEVFCMGWLLGELGLNHYEEAFHLAYQFLCEKEYSRMAVCAVAHYGAKAAYFQGLYDEAIAYSKQYIDGIEYFNTHIDEKNYQEGLPFITETFDEQWKKEVYSLIICAGLRMGTAEYLTRYWEELQWTGGNVYVFEDMADVLLNGFQNLEYVPVFYKIADAIWKHGGLRNYFLEEMERRQETGDISGCIAVFHQVKEAEEIKGQLVALKENGMIEQYRAILEQVKKLLPYDTEIANLYEKEVAYDN